MTTHTHKTHTLHVEYLEKIKKFFISIKLKRKNNENVRVKVELEKEFFMVETSGGSMGGCIGKIGSAGGEMRRVFELASCDDGDHLLFDPNTCRIDQKQLDLDREWLSFSVDGYSAAPVQKVPKCLGDFLEQAVREGEEKDLEGSMLPNQFACATCRLPFVSGFQACKYLHLPSDYWYEMTECWACHHEDYTTLPGQTGGTIFAQENVLLSGISYYLLHPNHVNLDRMYIRLTGREVSWNRILIIDTLSSGN